MRRLLWLGAFAATTVGSLRAGALDAVPALSTDARLSSLTVTVLDACADLSSYPTDYDPAKPGAQPIAYRGTDSTEAERLMAAASASQWVAPMTRPLGAGICAATAPREGAGGLVIALEAVEILVGPGQGTTEGVDYSGPPGDSSNTWRTVLREIYTGMGPSGSNVFARDCNSASRRALVASWDSIFRGSTGSACTDSNPDAAVVEPGLRHAFRPAEASPLVDVFLAQLALPAVRLQQPLVSNTSVIPTGSNGAQQAVYAALANSPFCNVRRPEDRYAPVNKGGSIIPPMYVVGLPSGAGGPALSGSQGLAPFDPSLGESARFLSPYLPEMHDQDPIRRRCAGPRVSLDDAPNAPREEVCSADGSLGLVLPISPPPELRTTERYPNLPCEDTRSFEFGPAPTRPTGDPVRCPNGDLPQDGQCLLPTRTSGTGFAFDCLNHGLNAPAAIYDSDLDGSEYPDAPTTDGRADVDGRVYNLILRAADGEIRSVARPSPAALGTMKVPMVGAFYRVHSSRSNLAAPQHTQVCSVQDDESEQIACLVQKNPCSVGFGSLVTLLGPPLPLTAVNGVAPTVSAVQAQVKGGVTYPLSRKVYLNSVRGFEALLTSADPGGVLGKDAELDFAECYAHLPFSTFAAVGSAQLNVASPSHRLIPLPAGAGGAVPRALCEDFDGRLCGDASNADACANNTGLIPTSACDNGLRDGDETGVDACPPARPTCNGVTHRCE